MDMEILFLDNHVLAVNKPPGLVTQPSGRHADSLETRAKAWLKERFAKPGRVFLEAIHRLDRPAAGVVLFARTGKALSRLNAAVRAGEITKIYLAVVEGVPEPAAARLEHHLVHGSHRARVAGAERPGARAARLEYRVLQRAGGLSLVRVRLFTGRYHQIRAQFAAIGHPLCGDERYGAAKGMGDHRIALLHREMTFPHPVRREPVVVRAPWPEGAPWHTFSPPANEALE